MASLLEKLRAKTKTEVDAKAQQPQKSQNQLEIPANTTDNTHRGFQVDDPMEALKTHILKQDYVAGLTTQDDGSYDLKELNLAIQKAVHDVAGKLVSQQQEAFKSFESHTESTIKSQLESFDTELQLKDVEYSENKIHQALAISKRDEVRREFPKIGADTLNDIVKEFMDDITSDLPEQNTIDLDKAQLTEEQDFKDLGGSSAPKWTLPPKSTESPDAKPQDTLNSSATDGL